MFILKSAMKVISWVQGFNPQNVNDHDLKLPEDLKQINNHTRALLKEYPR